MKRDLIIIGAGSVGGHVACSLQNYSKDYNLLGFLDDDEFKIGTDFVTFPVLGKIDSIINYPPTISIVIGIAFPTIKFKIVDKLKNLGYNNFPSLISDFAWLSANTQIGEGCIIYPGTTINYNCIFNDFVVVNMNCAIGHDCTIGGYVSFAPGVLTGGNTTIGELSEMGIGSKTLQGISIGQNCTIGGGAVVIRDIPANTTAVGIPAKVINMK